MVRKKHSGMFKKNDIRINKKGRPSILPEIRAVRNLAAEELVKIITAYIQTPYNTLKEIDEDIPDEMTAFQAVICSGIVKDREKGDMKVTSELLSRIGLIIPKDINLDVDIKNKTEIDFSKTTTKNLEKLALLYDKLLQQK